MSGPLPPERRAALTRRFQNVLATVGDSSARRLRPVWSSLDTYNEDQIPEFTRKAAPILSAAKVVAVKHAAAFYALTAGIAPVGVAVTSVAIEPQFRAPFISTWLALKGGSSLDDAIAAGEGRLDAIARDLVTSSARQTGDAVIAKADLKIIGWERIPDDSACDWCLSVAPGFYHSAESADFGHDRCGCTAGPIYA